MYNWDFINQPRVHTEDNSTSHIDRSCPPEDSDAHLFRVGLLKENLRLFDFETGAHVTIASSNFPLTGTSSKSRCESSAKSSTIRYTDKEHTSALQQRGCIFPSQKRPANYDDIKALKPTDQEELGEQDAWKIINAIQITPNELGVQALIHLWSGCHSVYRSHV
jgi:hypothetical protein